MRAYRLKFSIEEVRVGAGAEGNLLRALRYGDELSGTYVVPSSTWKGVFRRVSENLYGHSSAVHDGAGVGDEVREALEALRKKLKDARTAEERRRVSYEVLSRLGEVGAVMRHSFPLGQAEGSKVERFVGEMAKVAEEWTCPLEATYGTLYFAGAVTFSDSVLRPLEVSLTSHVSMDRSTGRAAEGNLFQEERVRVGSVYVTVVLRREDVTLELWRNTLRYMAYVGTGLGSGKSRGAWAVLDASESQEAEITLRRPEWRKLSLG